MRCDKLITPERIRRATALLKQGLTLRVIRERTGLSESYLSALAKSEGIDREVNFYQGGIHPGGRDRRGTMH